MENKQDKLLTEFPIPSYDQWLQLVEKQLKGIPFEKKLISKTAEGITLKPIYLKSDLSEESTNDSFPGFFPFTRSTNPAGSVEAGWKVSQQYYYPDSALLNDAIQHDQSRGLDALMLVIDKAGKKGFDPDVANDTDIGRDGLSLCGLQDLEQAFQGFDFSSKSILLDGGSSTFSVFGLLIGYLQTTGYDIKKLNGASVFDPLAYGCRNNSLSRSAPQFFDEMVGLVSWTAQYTPDFQPIGIDGRPYAESGGNAVQELAYALATAVEYIRELRQRGLNIDQAANSMSLFLGIGADFFTEIAKLRAARSLWARMISIFEGNEESQKLTIHSASINWNKTVHDPYVNILRATTEAYSGILGGCDTLSIAPFDKVLGLPKELSRRISRNIQIILKEECHGHKVIDPAGGAWFVEEQTRELAEKAWTLFQEIESSGGFRSALEKGLPQKAIEKTAGQRKSLVGRRKKVIVGANMYPNLKEQLPPTSDFDQNAFAKRRIDQARKWKYSRDKGSNWASLKDMSFQSPEFFNQIIDSVKIGLTLGEINAILSKDNSFLKLDSTLPIGRLSNDYEDLRKKSENHKVRNGCYPKVFLVNMGPLRQHKARADFSTGFLQPGGFEIITSDGFNAIEDAASAAIVSKANIVVICSTDDTYPDLVPPLTKLIKEQRPEKYVLVAGYPAEHVNDFRSAGVDDFIHLKADNLSLLQKLQSEAGVSS